MHIAGIFNQNLIVKELKNEKGQPKLPIFTMFPTYPGSPNLPADIVGGDQLDRHRTP
jgi:hypothetical protein